MKGDLTTMSENIIVTAQQREPHSSNSTGRLRREGLVPGIVYGPKSEPINIKVDKRIFEKIFYKVGEHTIISLDIENVKDNIRVLIKDYQIDPVDKHLTHVDFLRIADDRPVKTNIPVKIVGSAKGVKVGGIQEQFINYIKIKALPKYIPHFFEVDVSDLDILESIKIKEMDVPEGVLVLNPPDQTIVGIVTSRVSKTVLEGEEGEEAAEGVEGEGEEAAETPAGKE